MSDHFFGEVRFPLWAVQHVPGLDDDVRLYELETLGIPYDRESAEYYEYKTEDEYLRWVNQYKARVFRDNLQRLKSGARDKIGDMYRLTEETKGHLDGIPGIWVYQNVACGRIVTDDALDAAERDFREVMRIFRIGGITRIGAFVSFPERQQKSIADAVLWEIEARLRQIAGLEEV
ncbi:hypothetical protein B1757_02910 [Acidithiobacillus marinus]|uniref:Uncharacterized protein n=1 Tax=Acidithiobacillus marinus TaxID=187490 RepID=A0A2I1DPF1_9PROT|nr:hypothetical protein [Acidithiobacillus marinus]PKY11758.1 hypothetical protein B1757_02910 [Acidithiobacillus marinus]